MKKYILILFSIISFWSCTEDESIDITVLPSVTTTGANTFGCGDGSEDPRHLLTPPRERMRLPVSEVPPYP